MNNFKNKKVIVMGLGQMPKGSGVSSALFLARQKYKVIVTDSKPASQLNKDSINKLKKFTNIQLVLGKHRKKDFQNADLIIKNPAVKPNSSYIKIAKKNKIPVTTDLGLFFDCIKNKSIKTIGITGTRGKSTIANLLYKILKSKYKNKIYLGGNIGNSPLNFVSRLKRGDIAVMEMSSFQLHDLTNHHFNVSVITNILPDHLYYYKSMSYYVRDKQKIFLNQKKSDYLFLNKQDKKLKILAKKAKSKIIYYSKTKKIKLSEIKLLGQHNLSHIEVAWQITKIFKVPDKHIKKVILNFKGVKDRLEFIKEYKGVKFYNDTTATHPAATVAALKSLPKNKIILISGGNSKNLSLKEMAKEIKSRVKYLILAPGNANKDLPQGIKVKNLNKAVAKAWNLAKKGDVILFSPGLTWLPGINEFDRGEKFVNLVKRIS